MINGQDYELQLRQAAAKGNVTEVKKLINIVKNSGDIDAAGLISKQTALHRAAEKQHDEIIKLLLEAGANPLLQDKDKKTTLNLYFGQMPFLITQGKTSRCLSQQPANMRETLIKHACIELSKTNNSKEYYALTQMGDLIFADNPLELAILTMPYQKELFPFGNY